MRVAVRFEPRDLWVGAYVDTHKLRVYICLLPMFPIIVEWGRR